MESAAVAKYSTRYVIDCKYLDKHGDEQYKEVVFENMATAATFYTLVNKLLAGATWLERNKKKPLEFDEQTVQEVKDFLDVPDAHPKISLQMKI